MVDHMSDAAQSLQVSRKTIAGAIAHDLENGSAHGARVATSPYLDNYHIDGHVNLLALADAVIAAQPPAAPVETGDFYLVPREIIDQFPEINVNNYDHDDACALNTWGCEVVTNANPAPVQRSSRSVSLADGSSLSGSTLGLADLAGVAPGPSDAITEGERHAIAHARYQVERAGPENPDCFFDYEVIRDLLRVIDRRREHIFNKRCDDEHRS